MWAREGLPRCLFRAKAHHHNWEAPHTNETAASYHFVLYYYEVLCRDLASGLVGVFPLDLSPQSLTYSKTLTKAGLRFPFHASGHLVMDTRHYLPRVTTLTLVLLGSTFFLPSYHRAKIW